MGKSCGVGYKHAREMGLGGLLAFVIYRMVRKSFESRPEEGSRLPSKSPHEILGVADDADDAEIKSAYQKAVRENHPDKVADMSQELRDLAEKKTREVNDAYEQLKP